MYEAISGYFVAIVLARNYLASMLDYIVLENSPKNARALIG